MKKFPKTFCWRPFTELYYDFNTGESGPCCVYKDFNQFTNTENAHENIRKNILSGSWDSGCRKCQEQESENVKSHRHTFYGQKNLDAVVNNKFVLQNLELRIENTCNLACITCNSSYSSRWATENFKMYGEKPSKQRTVDLLKLFDINLWNGIVNLTLYGGEPLYSKTVIKLLNWLIENNLAQNINLIFYSNGTLVVDEILTCLSKFLSVRIGFSLDGIHERFEVIRWPASWNDVENNIRKVKSLQNVIVEIIYTYSMLNAFHIVDDINVLRNFSDSISLNPVRGIDYYDARNIPNDYKEKLILDYQTNEIASQAISILQNTGNEELFKVGITKLRELDRWRNTDSSILFPKEILPS